MIFFLTYNVYNGDVPNIAYPLIVGYHNRLDYSLNPYFDVLKIDKGICRHTSNFTPPSHENVDNDSYCKLLLKMNMSTFRNIGGSWKSAVPYRVIGGEWKAVSEVYRSDGTNWKTVI